MEMTPIESSLIREVCYKEEIQTLYVRFKNGTMYSYTEVPRNIFDDLMSAESIGKYFVRNIKTSFSFQKEEL